jgi:predicted DNA-binding transcriptional regulator AlpA
MSDESLLIYPKQVQEIFGVGPTKFYEINKLPDFPKAAILNGKRPMYKRKEIEEWVTNLK